MQWKQFKLYIFITRVTINMTESTNKKKTENTSTSQMTDKT